MIYPVSVLVLPQFCWKLIVVCWLLYARFSFSSSRHLHLSLLIHFCVVKFCYWTVTPTSQALHSLVRNRTNWVETEPLPLFCVNYRSVQCIYTTVDSIKKWLKAGGLPTWLQREKNLLLVKALFCSLAARSSAVPFSVNNYQIFTVFDSEILFLIFPLWLFVANDPIEKFSLFFIGSKSC